MKIAVQIGTNDSNDDFYRICHTQKYDKVYLIEPHSKFNDEIKKWYSKFSELVIEISNIAITNNQNDKETKLYSFNEEGTHDSLSLRKSHPIRSEKPIVDFITVPCMTFMKYCESKDIQEIEFLCIDTEGLDDEILMSIDFDVISINKIMWENWDHDDDDETNSYALHHVGESP